MSGKLYVGNLDREVGSEQLKELFSQAGTVVSVSIVTRRSGQSKGFGFVEMGSEEEANKAIEMFNGQQTHSRGLAVMIAKPKPPTAQGVSQPAAQPAPAAAAAPADQPAKPSPSAAPAKPTAKTKAEPAPSQAEPKGVAEEASQPPAAATEEKVIFEPKAKPKADQPPVPAPKQSQESGSSQASK